MISNQGARIVIGILTISLISVGILNSAEPRQQQFASTVQERIVVPNQLCVEQPSDEAWIKSEAYSADTASSKGGPTITLRSAMGSIIEDLRGGKARSVSVSHGVRFTGQTAELKSPTGSSLGALSLIYASDYVNVESWGHLAEYRGYGSENLWRLTLRSTMVDSFGAQGTVSVGEIYYDPTVSGSPALCLIQEVPSDFTDSRTFIGRPVGSASELFLYVNATSALPADCKTQSVSVICPAVRTALGTPISLAMTLDLKNAANSSVGTVILKGSVQGYTSTGYVKCTTSASCTAFGTYYAPYKSYESTIVNTWTDATLTATATYKTTAKLGTATITLLKADSPNIRIPWCTAMVAFVECFANVSLTADGQITVTAAGSATAVISPIEKTTTKAWTLLSGVRGSSKETSKTWTANVSAVSAAVSANLKMPRFTVYGAVTMQTIGGTIGAKAGLSGQLWADITLAAGKKVSNAMKACGAMYWSAKAWVKVSLFPSLDWSDSGTVLSGCGDIR